MVVGANDGGDEKTITQVFGPIKDGVFGGSPPPFVKVFDEIVNGDDRFAKNRKGVC